MTALPAQLVAAIDSARRRGQNYDEVVEAVRQHGVPVYQVEQVLARYRKIKDRHGRTREEINLGDPEEAT